jgi:hypothetical protein
LEVAFPTISCAFAAASCLVLVVVPALPLSLLLQPSHAFMSSAVNRTRLRELLQFALSHFTNGPDAHRLNELLQASQTPAANSSGGGAAAAAGNAGAAAAAAGPTAAGQPRVGSALAAAVPAYAASAMRFESSSLSERVQKPALLAPLMGILLAIWNAHSATTAAAAAGGGNAATAVGVDVLDELVQMADERFMSSLQFMQVGGLCQAASVYLEQKTAACWAALTKS